MNHVVLSAPRFTCSALQHPGFAIFRTGLTALLMLVFMALALGSNWVYAAQPPAVAIAGREAVPMAEDPKLEARLVDISQELRCMVCQNESLASSHAELAEDLRREVRDLIRQGNSDQEVKDFLVSRYGDFVLYRPEVKPLTWVLWFGPFLLLLVAAFLTGIYLRQRRQQVQPAPLSDADRARAQKILKA